MHKPLTFPKLLAKSLPAPDPKNKKVQRERKAAFYTGHIAFVVLSADLLLERMGKTILSQLGLESYVSLDYFVRTVRLGAYLHDWGKANQHFQEMVHLSSEALKSSNKRIQDFRQQIKQSWEKHNGWKTGQKIRHEVLSGILALQVPEFRNWLGQCDADLVVAVWAAMGHHLKIDPVKVPNVVPGTGDQLNVLVQHRDFKRVLKMGTGKGLKLPKTLPDCKKEIWSNDEIEDALKNLCKEFRDIEKEILRDSDRQRFIAAVKATVISADIAGSSIPMSHTLSKWMKEVLEQVLSEDDIQKLLTQRLGNNELRDFQRQIADTPCRVTLVTAGCGTGKTVAAYAWALRWIKDYKFKLFFGYPTTGTASQGFLDYAAKTDIEKTLIHSRSDIDLEVYETLFSGKSDRDDNTEARLEAFKAWKARLIICTVDSVLGLIHNNRKPLFSWPAIAQSAFVFDEVHSYGERLFGALIRFLKTFRGARILLMSASFTDGQVQAICQVMAELGEDIKCIKGPKELEELHRYQFQSVSSSTEAWDSVLETLKNRQKVLWVTNSVRDAVTIYEQAIKRLSGINFTPLIYHSRYRYQDRLDRHQEIIKAFDPEQLNPVFAITTQVCEMSLDLSANLLVTAIAPPHALIQRLGRLNRFVEVNEQGKIVLKSGCICKAIFYPWTSKKPYSPEELVAGRQFIEHLLLEEGDICQHDLSKVASQLGSIIPKPVNSTWLDDHWCARLDFLRDEGSTITVLLQKDIKSIEDAAKLRSGSKSNFTTLNFLKEAKRWAVPILIPPNLSNWKKKRYFYYIAKPDKVDYNSITGARELW